MLVSGGRFSQPLWGGRCKWRGGEFCWDFSLGGFSALLAFLSCVAEEWLLICT